ncbi:MAG: putative membrane protein YdfK [Syntrophorhabdus sp. PtaU1.Bin058]|nr:MAG: putative membrane protein YdfK [Syntrophorhabdus sp. PtaU1.Bin058]
MLGTFINAGTVILGSLIGLAIHARLPERLTKIAFQGIGLFTVFLGFTMAAKTNNFLVMIFSIVPGSIIGELIGIEKHMDRLAGRIKQKIKSENKSFSEGFITAFLLFCMGSMTILGAIQEGLGGRPDLLIAKSVLDGFSSLALAASLGVGVIFSVLPLLVYQGGITLFASSLQQFFTSALINELSAVGGLLLIGLGINILEIKRLSILNMLPSLVIAVILAYFFQ